MKQLTLFFACIALAASFNCSQANASWSFSLANGDVEIGTAPTTVTLLATLTGTTAPNPIEEFFDADSITLTSVTSDNNINFISSSTEAGTIPPLAIGDVVTVGTLNFNTDAGPIFGNIGTFDFNVAFNDFSTGGFPLDPNVESVTLSLTAVPEPTTLSFFGVGLVGLVARRRRK